MSLKVSDGEYTQIAQNMNTRVTWLEDELSKLCNYMDAVCSRGITAGNTAENFARVAQTVKTLRAKLLDVETRVSSTCSTYVSNIAEADKALDNIRAGNGGTN